MIKANQTEQATAAEVMAAYSQGLRDGQRFTVEELREIVDSLEYKAALLGMQGEAATDVGARCLRALLKAERILEAAEERA